MSPSLSIALVVDPFRLKRPIGDHATGVARELLGRGHQVRGFGGRGAIPQSSPEAGGGNEEGGGLSRFQPDVIVAYDPLCPAAWAAARVARRRRVPLVLVEEGHHGPLGGFERLRRRSGDWLWGAFVRRRAERLVALDGSGVEIALEQGFPEERILSLPAGVELQRYRPGLTSHVPSRHGVRGRFLLCLQRLEDGAGLGAMISAFAATVGRRGDWSLVFASDGPARQRLRTQADRLGVGSQVHWIETPRREELPGLLGASTLLVAPSLRDDVTGWRLRRALAAGLPVLVGDGARARSWVEPDGCGLLVPDASPEAWTDALRQAASAPERRRRWSARARAVAEETFAWPRLIEAFEEMLLAAQRARAARLERGAQPQAGGANELGG